MKKFLVAFLVLMLAIVFSAPVAATDSSPPIDVLTSSLTSTAMTVIDETTQAAQTHSYTGICVAADDMNTGTIKTGGTEIADVTAPVLVLASADNTTLKRYEIETAANDVRDYTSTLCATAEMTRVDETANSAKIFETLASKNYGGETVFTIGQEVESLKIPCRAAKALKTVNNYAFVKDVWSVIRNETS